MDELKVIMQDIENVYHQLGAVLRDLDMIVGTYEDPSNVDTDPPDEYVDGLLRGVELSEEFDHA